MQMKRMLIGLASLALVGYGVNAVAQTKVTLKEKPVALMNQNGTWVVPEGATFTYYSYSANGSDYVCTNPSTAPVELKTITGTTVSIKMNTGMRSVSCYPSSYFVMP